MSRAAVPAGHIGRNKAVLLVHVTLTSILAAVGLLYPVSQINADTLVYPACVMVTLVFAWILWSWRSLRRTLFEPYPLFIVTVWLFNAGQSFLELFGLNVNGMLGGRVPADRLVPGMFLVSLSAALLHFGALTAAGRNRAGNRAAASDPGRLQATRIVGWALLAIAAIPTVMLLGDSLSVVMDYGYMGLYRTQNSATLSQVLSALLVPGAMFLLAGSRGRRGIQALCLAVTGLYAGSYLFLGARGAAAMSCVSAAWLFERSIRRVPRGLIVALTVAALIVFPLVRETRNTGGRYRLSLGDQYEVLSNLENPISSSISEMGYSFVTVTHTLSLVPAVRGFDWGVSYLYAITAVVPNIGWEIHPSVAHGLLCDWLIKTVDPVTASAGGGLGFSFIAEAYLNFGWLGGPLWLALTGFALTRLFLQADGADPAKHALIASFLSFFFIFARGESAIVARGLVWYAAVPYLLVSLLTIRYRRKVGRP